MDFDVERCTRHCAITGRELADGEEFYSVLTSHGARLERKDYSREAWQGPPEGALATWRSRVPPGEAKKRRLAPNDVLLQLFQELASVPERRDMRYVLALLMIRRRLLRLEETVVDNQGGEALVLYCPRDESTHEVPVAMPDAARAEQIQQELAALLYTSA